MVVLTKNTAEKTPGFLRLVPGDDPGFSWLPERSGWTLGHRQGALGPAVCRTMRKPESHGRSQHLVYSPSRDAWATRSAISAASQGTEAGRQTQAEARKPAEAAGVLSRDLRPDSGLRNRESLCRALGQGGAGLCPPPARPGQCPGDRPSQTQRPSSRSTGTQAGSGARGHNAPQTAGHAGDDETPSLPRADLTSRLHRPSRHSLLVFSQSLRHVREPREQYKKAERRSLTRASWHSAGGLS